MKTYYNSFIVALVSAFAVQNVSAIPTCDGPSECCEKNWDLNKLDKKECYKFCSLLHGGCSMDTGENEYMEYLPSINIRKFPDETIRAVGYTQEQRDCLRYWQMKKESDQSKDTLWYKSSCCIEQTCTEYYDNYGGRQRQLLRKSSV